MDLTPDQQAVLSGIVDWYGDKARRTLTVGGYAGTGKTTLLGLLLDELGLLPGEVAFATPTGKAASVLGAKLQDNGVDSECSTLHSLLYRPILNERKELVGWGVRDVPSYKLIVVDEASMVSKQVWDDLLSAPVPKILAVGDHGQLPPVGGDLNLMAKPELRLEHVHRQALDNPILAAATAIRLKDIDSAVRCADGKRLWFGKGKAYLQSSVAAIPVGLDSAVLCHRNVTRVETNQIIRHRLGYNGEPRPGDLVIGLKNVRGEGMGSGVLLFNGQRGTLRSVGPAGPAHVIDKITGQKRQATASLQYSVELELDGGSNLLQLDVCRAQFNRKETFKNVDDFVAEVRPEPGLIRHFGQLGVLMDYGYALTVHKAQGSEFSDVVVAIEPSIGYVKDVPDFPNRWLYTAATRASQRLVMVFS